MRRVLWRSFFLCLALSLFEYIFVVCSDQHHGGAGGVGPADEVEELPKIVSLSNRGADGAEEFVRLAATYNDEQEYTKALEAYQKAFSVIVKRYGETALALGDINFYMGISSFRAGMYDQALKFFDDALRVYFANKIGRRDRRMVSSEASWMGLEPENENDESEVNEEADKAIMADLYYCIGLTYKIVGKNDEKMITMFEQSWALYQRHDIIMTSYGSSHSLGGEDHRRTSLFLTDHALKQDTIVGMLLNLSDAYFENGKLDKARDGFKDVFFASEEILRVMDDGSISRQTLFANDTMELQFYTIDQRMDFIIDNTPESSDVATKARYLKMNSQRLQAEETLETERKLYEKLLEELDIFDVSIIATEFFTATYSYFAGAVLAKQWQLKQSLQYTAKAVRIFETLGDQACVFKPYRLLQRIFLYLGLYEEALATFDKASNFLKKHQGEISKEIPISCKIQIDRRQYLQQMPNVTSTKKLSTKGIR